MKTELAALVGAVSGRVRQAPAIAALALLGCGAGGAPPSAAPSPAPVCPAPADASFASTTAVPRDRAKPAFVHGTACFREGRYDLAAHYFALADEASPHPSTTFNLALAHDHAGSLSKAVEAYERFLATAPVTDPQFDFASERVKYLRKGLPHGCTAAEKVSGLKCPPPNSPPY